MASPLLKFIEKVCVQSAYYWASSLGVNDGFGNITYPDPVTIKCRWDGKVQMVADDKGEEVVSHAEILVTTDLPIGGVLQLVEDGVIATMDSGQPIISSIKVPLFRSTTEFVRTVFV